MNITVLKRDGTRQPYNANLINQALEKVCENLTDPVSKVIQIATETELTLFDGITTEQLDQAIINTAVQNIKDDPEYDTIATRLFLKLIYKKVLGDFKTDAEFQSLHKAGFAKYIKKGLQEKVLDKRFASPKFNLKLLAEALDPKRDSLNKYIGLTAMVNRYMLKGRDQVLMETPQYFWMRVAMGLSLTEKNPTKSAIAFYDKMSKLEYLAAGSTLVNAGT